MTINHEMIDLTGDSCIKDAPLQTTSTINQASLPAGSRHDSISSMPSGALEPPSTAPIVASGQLKHDIATMYERTGLGEQLQSVIRDNSGAHGDVQDDITSPVPRPSAFNISGDRKHLATYFKELREWRRATEIAIHTHPGAASLLDQADNRNPSDATAEEAIDAVTPAVQMPSPPATKAAAIASQLESEERSRDLAPPGCVCYYHLAGKGPWNDPYQQCIGEDSQKGF